MHSRFLALVTLSLFFFLHGVEYSPTHAGKFNPEKNIGDPAPVWADLPGTDEKTHSMKDFEDKEVLVLVFTCNSCPYAVDYEERVNNLAKQYSSKDSKVGLVAINVNKIEADKLPAMIRRATERQFVFPYLYDETQQIAKDYGAERTPEVFVLNKDRRIVYMGAIDDNSVASKVTKEYAKMAIEATLHGKTVETKETAPVGCAIRYARNRK